MKTLILGAGNVGYGIATYLNNRQENVSVIEQSPERIAKIQNISDLDIIAGNAMDITSLKKADAENAEYIIATMFNDEQNIIACKLAGAFFNAKIKIARIKSAAFLHGNTFELFLKENFNIDIIIHPEAEVMRTVCDIAETDGSFDVIHTEYTIIIGLKCLPNTVILNTIFSHFNSITDLNIFVLTITRNGKTFFPTGNDVLMAEDEIYIATTKKHINAVMRLFGYNKSHEKQILIVGGNKTNTTIAKIIFENNSNIKISIIEKSITQAEQIATAFPYFNVLHGEPINYHLLSNINHNIDTVIVNTEQEKLNILTALFLKNIGIKRILVLTESNYYNPLIPLSSGYVDINTNSIIINTILQKFHKGKIKPGYQLKTPDAEIIEVTVTASCTHIGQSIKSLKILDQIIPVFLIRSGITMSAQNEIILCTNDVIVMLITKNGRKIVEKIFSGYVHAKNTL